MAKFDLKKAILENKATFFSSLTEGQFSWMTQDTGQQIGSQDGNTIPVYMFDDKGKYYYENEYDGYGEFGGKDYYELLDQMNGGLGDRSRGIDLAFGKEKTGSEILFPALVTKPDKFNYRTHNFAVEAETDPNQSWLAPEEDDFYDQNDEEVFGDMDKEEDYDYSDEEELEEVKTTNTKMKKSEFKDKIKEMILKEMEDEKVVDVNDETPESEEDFLAELEGMLNEASEFDTNKPARIAAFIKDLDALMDEYHAELYLFGGVLDAIEMVKKVAQEEIDMLNEAEGDEEVTDDVTTDDVAVDDTETIDTTTTTEVNPDVKAVQDSLTQAQAAAQKLGDPKLTDQIGNTITFFTRNHVVEKGAVAEVEEMEEEILNESMFPILKRILK
jgi:DNA-binding ferritin-like protein (Dps family)